MDDKSLFNKTFVFMISQSYEKYEKKFNRKKKK